MGRHGRPPQEPPGPEVPLDPEPCRHRRTVVLDGRRVCNEGCGADLGPA